MSEAMAIVFFLMNVVSRDENLSTPSFRGCVAESGMMAVEQRLMEEKRTVFGEKITPELGMSGKKLLVYGAVCGVGTTLLFFLFDQMNTFAGTAIELSWLAGIAGGLSALIANWFNR